MKLELTKNETKKYKRYVIKNICNVVEREINNFDDQFMNELYTGTSSISIKYSTEWETVAKLKFK